MTYGAYGQLPDLRGEFIRGWVHNRSGITGESSIRTFGSWQVDDFKSHTHFGASTYFVYTGGIGGNIGIGPAYSGATGGDETRPRNIALLPCIKF